MMKATHSITNAERVGQRLGRVWCDLARQEACAMQWLLSKGLPAGLGRTLFWIVKLAVFAVLLYVAFWLVLLMAFVLAAAWGIRNADWESDDPEPEWRDGLLGFGLYDSKGLRVDPHDPDEQP